MKSLLSLCVVLFCATLHAAEPGTVRADERKPDPEDATESLQAAIDSGAETVRVPALKHPWIIRPIQLRSNLTLIFEDGVTIQAKKGEFLGKLDSLFNADNVKNLVIKGEGTVVLEMRKDDYHRAPYPKSEWRMGIALRGCEKVLIENLTVRNTGGDGVYLGVTAELPGCRDVTIRKVIADGNNRQGLSIISGSDILVEDCVFKNTSGTAPSVGLDIEPSAANQFAERITVRNCIATGNDGPGFMVYLLKLKEAKPIGIVFESCQVFDNNGAGLVVGGVLDNGPAGTVLFKDCRVERTEDPGIYIYDKAADGTRVIFENCRLENVARSIRGSIVSPELVENDIKRSFPNAPIVIYQRRANIASSFGGVDLKGCHIEEAPDRQRPSLVTAVAIKPGGKASDVTGTLTSNLLQPSLNLDGLTSRISVQIKSTSVQKTND